MYQVLVLVLPKQFYKLNPKDFQNERHVLAYTAHKGYIQVPRYQISNYKVCFNKLQGTCNMVYLKPLKLMHMCFQALLKYQNLQVSQSYFWLKICFKILDLYVKFSSCVYYLTQDKVAQTNSLFQLLRMFHSMFSFFLHDMQDHHAHKTP